MTSRLSQLGLAAAAAMALGLAAGPGAFAQPAAPAPRTTQPSALGAPVGAPIGIEATTPVGPRTQAPLGTGLPPQTRVSPAPTAPLLAPGEGEAPAEEASSGFVIPGTGVTVTGTAATGNDYLFRGISQTRNNWAFQGTVDFEHESGVYVGAFISNAKFLASPYNNTRQEVDILAGYRFDLGPVEFDVGWVGYTYPGQTKPVGTQLNEYMEVVVKASYTLDPVKVMAAYAYSPNFFGRSGTGNYLEGGLDLDLPYDFTFFGRVGYQWIQNNPRFGTPDYLWYGVGVSREIYWGVTASVGWYGTNISQSQCAPVPDRATGGQRICAGRVLFTLSKTF